MKAKELSGHVKQNIRLTTVQIKVSNSVKLLENKFSQFSETKFLHRIRNEASMFHFSYLE